jgi:hypothetical protein
VIEVAARARASRTGVRCAAAAAAIGAAAAVFWVWGASFRAPGVISDELAYLLQGALFASARWTAPGRPLPVFFDQWHTLVTPVVAAKYPPGHSLLLSLGIAVGLPALVPLLLTGATAALFVCLAAETVSLPAALMGCIAWVTMRISLVFRPGYFSECTTSLLWLLGWWALARWRREHRTQDLVLVAISCAWCLITRPLTGLVFTLPVVIVVVSEVARRRAWRALVAPLAAGTTILGLLPLWSLQTTGSWHLSPLQLYTRQYMPWDVPGFGAIVTPAARPLPVDLAASNAGFLALHASHLLAALPTIALTRLSFLWADVANGWHLPLLLVAVLGLAHAGRIGWFALATCALLFLAHLSYAMTASWTIYYLEMAPVLGFLIALGVERILQIAAVGLARWRLDAQGHARIGAWALVALLVIAGEQDVRAMRVWRAERTGDRLALRTLIEALPEPHTIIFVRYAPGHAAHGSLIDNPPDLAGARTWIVYDRGTENARLLALAPDRAPYLVDEAAHTLTHYISPTVGHQ